MNLGSKNCNQSKIQLTLKPMKVFKYCFIFLLLNSCTQKKTNLFPFLFDYQGEKKEIVLENHKFKVSTTSGPCGEKFVLIPLSYVTSKKIVVGDKNHKIPSGLMSDKVNIYNAEKKLLQTFSVPYGTTPYAVGKSGKILALQVNTTKIDEYILIEINKPIIKELKPRKLKTFVSEVSSFSPNAFNNSPYRKVKKTLDNEFFVEFLSPCT